MSPSPSSTPPSSSNADPPSNPSGVTGTLSTWIHSFDISNAPPEVLARAKHLLLDGAGCALVAAHLPWSETAARAIFALEPAGDCTVVGYGGRKLGPMAAVLLNSAFVQGFELDDYHSRAPLHSVSILLPVLLAAAEHADRTISGREFLAALLVGFEVGPRVGLALNGAELLSRGWHSGSLQAPSAAAAAVGALLKLSPAQIEWALGSACTQAGGLMSAQFGSMAKRMQHGFGARNGLLAAMLAKEGYTGIQEVYETSYGGFLSCFGQGSSQEPKTRPEELVKDLGKVWEIMDIRVKLHAAMAALHGTIDAVEHLQAAHPDRFKAENLDDIQKIETQHSTFAYEHGGWKAPADTPFTSTSAQMSIQYAAAAQLVDRVVLMDQFGAAKLNRPILRKLVDKTTPRHNEEFDKDSSDHWKTVVSVTFADGKSVEETVMAPKGIDPPVSNSDVVEKWHQLTQKVLSEERRSEIERCILSLEELSDVRELGKLLSDTVVCPIDVVLPE